MGYSRTAEEVALAAMACLKRIGGNIIPPDLLVPVTPGPAGCLVPSYVGVDQEGRRIVGRTPGWGWGRWRSRAGV